MRRAADKDTRVRPAHRAGGEPGGREGARWSRGGGAGGAPPADVKSSGGAARRAGGRAELGCSEVGGGHTRSMEKWTHQWRQAVGKRGWADNEKERGK